ncbi:MAG: cell division protein FtsL [Acidobacteriia bacterium]|nr:cell division protein FtsL [Terriglobia bacterium]
MATLPTYFRKDEAVIYGDEASAVMAPRAAAQPADPYRLRALPNENVYFFSKSIDNSRLQKQKDPRAAKECWSAIGAFAALAILLAGALAPSVGGTFAGYQLQALKQERQRLVDERSRLEVDEAALISPERLERLAHAQRLLEPAPGQVIHLEPHTDGSLAMNLRK